MSEVGITLDDLASVALVPAADAPDTMIFRIQTGDGRVFCFGASVRDTFGIVSHLSDVLMTAFPEAFNQPGSSPTVVN